MPCQFGLLAFPWPCIYRPGGVGLRHMLLNCLGSVLQKSSEVGRGESGVPLGAGVSAWL